MPRGSTRFGEDGGKFHYYYDQLADELDEDLTKRLKSQLDSLLIFAGLFAGVNSAFLALTLPMMSADHVNDTNALLLQLVKGGNATINSEVDLASSTFSPPPAIYPVNVLFAVSLTCALMSSFLAVLGQQWLVYYRKRSGGGAEHQRKEQLCRQLGAQRWRLELVLDDVLPGLLQVGLVIFCIAFVIYLRTLSSSMSSIVAAMVGTALVIRNRRPSEPKQPNKELKTKSREAAEKITSRGLPWFSRKEETANDLAIASVKRVILTSEHTNALIHAAINLCAIDDTTSLQQLLNETEFLDRLYDLFYMFYHSRPRQPMRKAAGQAFASAILHMLLSVGTLMNLTHSKYQQAIEDFSQGRQAMPRDLRTIMVLLGDQFHSYAHSEDTGHFSHLQLL
ncbi:hypothetical protein FRC01_003832, partial [Tulasnella sp. 417]